MPRDPFEFLSPDQRKLVLSTYGDKAIQIAAETQEANRPRLSSGIVPLDAALGGGFDPGKMHVIYGDPSGAKSYTCYKTIASTQASCSRCFRHRDDCHCEQEPRKANIILITSENDWDREWVTQLGVDIDDLFLCSADYAEKGLDVADMMVRSAKLDLLVIDSLAFLVPSTLIESSVGKDHMGVEARIFSKGIRKLISGAMRTSRDTDRKPTMLFTNQTRFKLGVMFGNPETTPGGQTPKFGACTETRVSKVRVKVEKKMPVLAEAKFKIRKNKTFEPFHEGHYEIVFAPRQHKLRGAVADEAWMLGKAKDYGLFLKPKGAKKWSDALPDGISRSFTTEKAFRQELEKDQEYKRRIREALLILMLAR